MAAVPGTLLSTASGSMLSSIVAKYRPKLDVQYHDIYRYLHGTPELSFQEEQTAKYLADRLKALSWEIEVHVNIGGHGVVGVFRNGTGPTVLLRAEMDGLPVREATNLPYASTARQVDVSTGESKPVMAACGHDMHMTSLLAATELLLSARTEWCGTLLILFQPAEERGAGAQAMVNDGLYDKLGIKPSVVLGGHVIANRAGRLGTIRGLMASSADSLRVTLYGRGGHASQPHLSIDPVLMAAHTVVRLQGIVAREVAPMEPAVITVAAINAGNAENVIPDQAELKINVRSYSAETRKKSMDAIERIVRAESTASGSPQEPKIESTSSFPLTINSEEVTQYDNTSGRLPGSEDFSILATSIDVPSCFWVYGGVDTQKWDEAEHAGRIFLETIHPSLHP
ncbi:metal-dependent amidase/aminoacylase/carboxypeptidase [Auriculariales sp. MPI-PUGE-AT-0066]|nr:metal-dependent amidase/aminoacylase/carboxypeptidase [Auriculariales sp. MPI-PUGE-AT-0066]